MIRFVNPNDLKTLSLFREGRFDPFAIKQLCQAAAYGEGRTGFDLWAQYGDDGVPCVLISRLSGLATLSGRGKILSDPQYSELRDFLGFLGAAEIEGEAGLIGGLFPQGKPVRRAPVMRMPRDGPLFDVELLEDVVLAPSLTEIYRLLCKADNDFAKQVCYEAFLTDLSHRCRHGLASCMALIRDGIPVCTLSILYRSGRDAVVGGLATLPDYRKRGLAKKIMSRFCRDALLRGDTLWLMAVDEAAGALYQSWGWQAHGEWVKYEGADCPR